LQVAAEAVNPRKKTKNNNRKKRRTKSKPKFNSFFRRTFALYQISNKKIWKRF
jgi:hypothetical protein